MENSHYSHFADINNPSDVPWNISDVIFIYFCIFSAAIIFAGFLLNANIDADMSFFAIAFQIFISLSILMLVYLIVTKKYHQSFNEAFGIYPEKMPFFLNTGIIAAGAMIISTTIITLIFTGLMGEKPSTPYTKMPEESFRWLGFLAIFFAPVVEEIFFRGFMQPAVAKKTGAFLAIIITALIFGVSHTQYLDYKAAFYSVTAIGLILGITRHLTGSVMPGIFAHFFNNLLAVIYILL